MKNIKEKAQEWADIYPSCGMADKSFQAGANCVLEETENFMEDLDLGNSEEEKFHKLDALADIHGFIQKLKEK